MEKKILIIYNPEHLELVFPIAVIGSVTPNFILLPVTDITQLENSSLIDEELNYLESQASRYRNRLIRRGLSPKRAYARIPELTDIHLINIGPKTKSDLEIITNFCNKYSSHIQLWIDTVNDWPLSIINYLNNDGIRVLNDCELSVLDILKILNYDIPVGWPDNYRDIQNHDLTDPWSRRYIMAMAVNKVIGTNLLRDQMNDVFTSAVDEIIFGSEDQSISDLQAAFPDMIAHTKKIQKMISGNSPYFTRAKQAGCPVGYVELTEMNNLLNTQSVLLYGRELFPWLFILAYRLQGSDVFHLTSKLLNTDQILPESEWKKYNKETLMYLLEGEVLYRQKQLNPTY